MKPFKLRPASEHAISSPATLLYPELDAELLAAYQTEISQATKQ